MSTNTIIVLVLYFIIAFIPKVPFYIKLAAQVGLGCVIYFAFGETWFDLPMGDESPISSVSGGDGGLGSFNKYSMGVIGTVLGFVATAVATVLYAVIGGKSGDDAAESEG